MTRLRRETRWRHGPNAGQRISDTHPHWYRPPEPTVTPPVPVEPPPYTGPIFDPSALRYYGRPIPISSGRRALDGVLLWSSPTYGSENHLVDFAIGFGYPGANPETLERILLIKMWMNGNLVLDRDREEGNQRVEWLKYRFYSGTEDQTPDKTIIEHEGEDNAVAFRGMIYVVIRQWSLVQRGAIPSVRVEIADQHQDISNKYPIHPLAPNFTTFSRTAWADINRDLCAFLMRDNNLTTDASRVTHLALCSIKNRREIIRIPMPWTGFGHEHNASINGFVYIPEINRIIIKSSETHDPLYILDGTTGAVINTHTIGSATGDNDDRIGYTYSLTDANKHFDNQRLQYYHCHQLGTGNAFRIYKFEDETNLITEFSSGNIGTINFINNKPFFSGELFFNQRLREHLVRLYKQHRGIESNFTGIPMFVCYSEFISMIDINQHGFQDFINIIAFGPNTGPYMIIPCTDNINIDRDNMTTQEIDNMIRSTVAFIVFVGDDRTNWSTSETTIYGMNAIFETVWINHVNHNIRASTSKNYGLQHSDLSAGTLGWTHGTGSSETYYELNINTGSLFTYVGIRNTGFNTETQENEHLQFVLINMNQNSIYLSEQRAFVSANISNQVSGATFSRGYVTILGYRDEREPLSKILEQYARLAGYDPNLITVNNIDDEVDGSIIDERVRFWDVIDQMRRVFLFDFIERDGQITFLKRNDGENLDIDVTVNVRDETARLSGTGQGPSINISRYDPNNLPRSIEINYRDFFIDSLINTARAQRTRFPEDVAPNAGDSHSYSIPVIIRPHEAAYYANMNLYRLWSSQYNITTRLGRDYYYLEPTDVVLFELDNKEFLTKLREITYNGDHSLSISADVWEMDSEFVISLPPPIRPIPPIIPGPSHSIGLLVDTNIIEPLGDIAIPLYNYAAVLAISDAGWTGAVFSISTDDGTSFDPIFSTNRAARYGVLNEVLAPTDTPFTTDFSSVELTMIVGEMPESITREELLENSNMIVIGQPGRWEIINFKNVNDLGGNRYRIDTFLRGRRGTENNVNNHQTGDYIIFVDDLVDFALDTSLLDEEIIYRAVGDNTQPSTAMRRTGTITGAPHKPWAPGHLRQEESGSDSVLRWSRRTRISGPWSNADGPENVPLDEDEELYEVDIVDDGTVVRTIDNITTEEFTYTDTMKTTDGFNPSGNWSWRVYQISAIVGRGYRAERLFQ